MFAIQVSRAQLNITCNLLLVFLFLQTVMSGMQNIRKQPLPSVNSSSLMDVSDEMLVFAIPGRSFTCFAYFHPPIRPDPFSSMFRTERYRSRSPE